MVFGIIFVFNGPLGFQSMDFGWLKKSGMDMDGLIFFGNPRDADEKLRINFAHVLPIPHDVEKNAQAKKQDCQIPRGFCKNAGFAKSDAKPRAKHIQSCSYMARPQPSCCVKNHLPSELKDPKLLNINDTNSATNAWEISEFCSSVDVKRASF